EQRRRARLVCFGRDRDELALFGGLGLRLAARRRPVARAAQPPLDFRDDDRIDQLGLVADICRGAPFRGAFAGGRFFGGRAEIYLSRRLIERRLPLVVEV